MRHPEYLVNDESEAHQQLLQTSSCVDTERLIFQLTNKHLPHVAEIHNAGLVGTGVSIAEVPEEDEGVRDG